jgi:hypothetical protein
MNGNRRWVGWLAIGLGTLALAVALFGRGFGPSAAAAGFANRGAPQAYAQQDPRQPGANAQPNAGPQANGSQSNPGAPGANAQPGAGAPMAGHGQGGPGAGAGPRNGRPGGPRAGMGGWFGFLPRLGGLFQVGLLALVAVVGVWLLRDRGAGSVPASAPDAPAQEPAPQASEPESESYVDEPGDQE